MSTVVLGMELLGAQPPHFDMAFNTTSKTPSMYGTSDHWVSSQQGVQSTMATSDYLGFPGANARPSGRHFSLPSNYEQSNSNDHDFRENETFFNNFKTQPSRNVPLGVSTAALFPSPAMFTASNTQIDPYHSSWDARFDIDRISPTSDAKSSFDSQMHYVAPPSYEQFIDNSSSLPSKHRCDSIQSDIESHSSTLPQGQVGRRRGSEYAEPGSARAIYLEKNRKAASKCRSKQKRQQEELVEAARDVERRNKKLKAEVESLKSGMRDLMELVGQHTNCPDARLKLYLQREADRLAVGGRRNTMHSPLSGSSYSGPGSVDKTSSNEDD